IYYGVDVGDLTLAQIAMMAGLYKAPSKYNPIANPQRAKLRRNYVLRRMYEKGYITRDAFRQAANAPLTARVHAAKVDVEAGYVAEMVRAYLYQQYGDDVYSMGLKVTTTINTPLQQEANLALRKALIDYDYRHGYRGPEATYDLAGKKTADYDHFIENHPTFGGLRSALVIDSDARSATLYLGDGEVADLDLKAVRWARPYIDEDNRGPRPKRVGDVLKPGDLVRLARDEDRWRLSQLPEVGGALVSISAIDGRIFALIGGFDYYYSRFNRATQAVRQPGSNFKPFVYSAALAKGFTPASIFNDAPIVHETEINGEERLWRPDNYSGKFQGPTRLRMALAHSKNLVSIRLLQKVGVHYALRHIRKFEMTKRPLPADLSLALGTGSLTPLELISGYAVIANQGYRVEPWFISKIEDRDGALLYRHAPFVACDAPCENLVTPEMVKLHPEALENTNKIYGRPARRVLDRDNMFQMVSMMKDVIRVGTGRKARVLHRNDLAGKTGTTNDQRDAWFSGFNREIVTTVWIGFDQHKPLGKRETGGHLALPAWIDYMRAALRDSPQRPWKMPKDLVTVKIDPETGLRAGPDTRNPVFEIFRPNHVPPEAAASVAPMGAEVPEQIF
ncbi:MAG TPA: peptidase, partial [Gammaproteobacteria bacterium]|nr:peptidase [Gammaproteobacteria bacterium]